MATPPKVVKKPQIKPELGGKRITFTTTVESFPKPDVQWLKSGNPIEATSKYNFQINDLGNNKWVFSVVSVGF